jgi:subtilisin family serine protease
MDSSLAPRMLTCYQENGANVFTGQFDDTFNILRTDRWITHTTSQDRRNDYSSNGHGTKVASKVQSTWGIAKKATIIPVQTLSDSPDDLTFGFNEVYRDLRRRRAASSGSELKSVSTTLLGERYLVWNT